MNRRVFLKAGSLSLATATLARTVRAQVSTPSAAGTENPFVFGTGLDRVPAGNQNAVEVVAQSTLIGSDVAFVVRNTTSQVVSVTDVIGTVRDSAGKLLDTVGFAEFQPKTLQPNGVTFGRAYFSESSLPLDAVVELVVKAAQGASEDYVSLPIVELEPNSDGFVGAVENPTGFPLDVVEVIGVTLAEDGTPIGHFSGYVDADTMAGTNVGYFDGYLQGQPSPLYLIAASGR